MGANQQRSGAGVDGTFRRSAWRKRTFVRIFLATLLVSFVILSISSLIHYRDLEEITVQQIEKSGIESLNRAKSVFAAIHLWLISTVRELRYDPAVERMLSTNDPQERDISRALNSLDNALQYYRWLDSVYIYNRPADVVLSTIDGVEASPYSDLDLKRMLLNPVRPQPYRYKPRAIRANGITEDGRPLPSGERRNVWTVVLDDTDGEPAVPQAWLVVNILEKEIREDFLSAFLPGAEQFFVIRKNGVVVSHPDDSLFRINIAGRSLVSHIISRPESQGSFELRSAGSKQVVSYVTYDELDWYLISITPYTDFMAPVARVRRVSLLLFAGFMLLAGLLAFIFSRQIYSPIERLMGFAVKVRGQLPPDVDAHLPPSKSELQFLSEMFQRVADQADRLNRAQERYERAHFQELFKQLLEGRLTSDELLNADQVVGLKRDEAILVLVVRLDNYPRLIKEFQSREIRSIFQRLSSFMAEYIPYDHYLVDMGEDHASIVVGVSDTSDSGSTTDLLGTHVVQMHNEFRARFQWSLTVGMSSEVHDMEDLPDAYREALDATKLRFCRGYGAVITAEHLDSRDKERTYSFPEESIRLMLYSVQKGELAPALETLAEVLDEVRDYGHDDFTVLVQFTKYMSLKMLGAQRHTATSRQADALRMIESVDDVETAEQAKEQLGEAYRLYTMGLEASHSQETIELVASIKSHVMHHLDDANLSPDLLASNVHLSTNHVRRIFKEYTGISLSAFITKERISLCKQLLVQTDLTVKEIYCKAGFSNYSNFFTTFKRVTGQTPGDYRQTNSVAR